MSEAKHTPGPWTCSDDDRYVRASIYANPKDRTCPAICSSNAWDQARHPEYHLLRKENAKANARLIAAAPDLLAACEEALEAFGDEPLSDDPDKPETDRFNAILALTYAVDLAKGGAE